MRRIAIVGCSGGGKSTLARRLGEKLDLPVIHLDVLFWRPGWAESDPEAFRGRVAAAHAGGNWICDGNFTSIADLTIAKADTIVWVDQRRALCLARVLMRVVTHRPGRRPDMAPGCEERFDLVFLRYIWTWDRLARPRLEAAIETHGAAAAQVRLKNDAEIADFLARASPTLTQA